MSEFPSNAAAYKIIHHRKWRGGGFEQWFEVRLISSNQLILKCPLLTDCVSYSDDDWSNVEFSEDISERWPIDENGLMPVPEVSCVACTRSMSPGELNSHRCYDRRPVKLRLVLGGLSASPERN